LVALALVIAIRVAYVLIDRGDVPTGIVGLVVLVLAGALCFFVMRRPPKSNASASDMTKRLSNDNER